MDGGERVRVFQVGLGTFGTSSLAIWRQLGFRSQGELVDVVGFGDLVDKPYEEVKELFPRANITEDRLPKDYFDYLSFTEFFSRTQTKASVANELGVKILKACASFD